MKWPPKDKNKHSKRKKHPASKRVRRGLERGQRNEMLVYRSLTSAGEKPDWLVSCRLATLEEDAQGIDLVVTTEDVGDLLIQVKSSTEMAKAFRVEQLVFKPIRQLVVIVPYKGENLEQLRKRTIMELLRLRYELLIKTGQLTRGGSTRLPKSKN